MKKHILSTILVLYLSISLFTACGTSNTNTNSTEIGNTPSEENNITTEIEQQPTEKEIKLVKANYVGDFQVDACEYNEYGEKIEQIIYDKDDAILYYTTYEYDDYGNIIKEISHDEYNGVKTILSSSSMIYEYDEQGRLIFVYTSWDKGETYDAIAEYIYDENGNNIKINSYWGNKIEIETLGNETIYEYDSNNNCIKELDYAYGEILGDGNFSQSANGPDKVLWNEYIYTYDSNNNLTSKTHYDYLNNTKKVYTYKYDSNNNKIEFTEEFYRDGEQLTNEITTYKYNEHNHCTEEKLTNLIKNTSHTITREYQYNEDGSYTVTINDDGEISTDIYDEFGNFLESTGGKFEGRIEYETRTVKVRPTR